MSELNRLHLSRVSDSDEKMGICGFVGESVRNSSYRSALTSPTVETYGASFDSNQFG